MKDIGITRKLRQARNAFWLGSSLIVICFVILFLEWKPDLARGISFLLGILFIAYAVLIAREFNALASLEQQIAERTQAIETAAIVSRRLSTVLDVRQLVEETVQQLQQTYHYYHVHIYLFDPQKEYLVMTGGTGEAGRVMLSQGHKIQRGLGLVGRASDTCTAVLASDTNKDPNWLPNPLLPETKSEIAVPIMIGDEVLGALDVQQNIVNGLTKVDLDLLQLISSQVAVAIRNARIYENVEKRIENERIISSIIDHIQSTKSMEESVQVATREIERVINIPCNFTEENLSKEPGSPQVRIISQSLKVHGDVIGYLAIEDTGKLDNNTLNILKVVAERLSSHLDNISLSNQTQQALAETDALLGITADLNAAQEFQDVLKAITDRTILKAANQSLMMCLFDHPLSQGQVPEWILPVAYRIDLPIEIAPRYPVNAFEIEPFTIFTNQIVVIKDVSNDPRLDRITRKLFQDVFHSNSSLIVPLLLADQSLGFVMANFSDYVEFSNDELQRLNAIAGQVAIAIQGLQLLKQTQERVKREQLLREVTAQINSATSTDVVLYRAAQELGRVLKQQIFIYLGDGQARLDKTSPEEIL